MGKHKHDHDHPCHCGKRHHGQRGYDHDCDCSEHHDHKNHQHQGGRSTGFALGVAIGAAVATLMAPDEGKKTRDKAKKKLDELTGGKTPEELLDSIKSVVGTVVKDIKDAATEGKQEAKETEAKILKSAKRPRRKK